MTVTTRCPEPWAPTHMERCSLDAGHIEPHSAYAADGRRGGWRPTTKESTSMTEQITETPTPELAQAAAPGRHWLDLANETPDPLECIAMALTGLLEVAVVGGEVEAQADDQSALVAELDDELSRQVRVIEGVRSALGKSTSQVAEKVRAALGDAPAKTDPSGSTQPETPVGGLPQPAKDDDVEQWRAYARSQGATGVEELNRSQIRTLLGISNG